MRNNLETGRRKISIFTPTLTEKKITKKNSDSMITQAIKAPTKDLEVALGGRMQKKCNSFYWTCLRPHSSQLHLTWITSLTQLHSLLLLLWYPTVLLPCKKNAVTQLNTWKSALCHQSTSYELLHNLTSLENLLSISTKVVTLHLTLNSSFVFAVCASSSRSCSSRVLILSSLMWMLRHSRTVKYILQKASIQKNINW